MASKYYFHEANDQVDKALEHLKEAERKLQVAHALMCFSVSSGETGQTEYRDQCETHMNQVENIKNDIGGLLYGLRL